MLAVLAALTVLARAPTPEYAAIRDPTIVCSDPGLLAEITYWRERHVDSDVGPMSLRAGKCKQLFPEQRIYVDFLENIPWRVDAEQVHSTARMFRGRLPGPGGVDEYFYGLAAEFTYVGPEKP